MLSIGGDNPHLHWGTTYYTITNTAPLMIFVIKPTTHVVHFVVCKPTLYSYTYKWISAMQSVVQNECVYLEAKVLFKTALCRYEN